MQTMFLIDCVSITSGGRLRDVHCILVHIEALIVAALLLAREDNVSVPPTDTMKVSIVEVQLGKPYTPCGGEYTPFGGEYTPVGGSVASCEASGHLPLGGLAIASDYARANAAPSSSSQMARAMHQYVVECVCQGTCIDCGVLVTIDFGNHLLARQHP